MPKYAPIANVMCRVLFLRGFKQGRQVVRDMRSRMQEIGHGNHAFRSLCHTRLLSLRECRRITLHKPDFHNGKFSPLSNLLHNPEHLRIGNRARTAVNQDKKGLRRMKG